MNTKDFLEVNLGDSLGLSHILCAKFFNHFFKKNMCLGKKISNFKRTLPKVYSGNMYKVIPDLNNIDMQSIVHPTEGLVPLTRIGYLAVQTEEFNPAQDLSLSLPSSNIWSRHCPGAYLT